MIDGSGEIRTRAPEETGALNQRLRPLGHATVTIFLLILRNNPFRRNRCHTVNSPMALRQDDTKVMF